ncbi:MAG: hypothetical protein QOF48_1165 [Verrucomicrobiota bacterium]
MERLTTSYLLRPGDTPPSPQEGVARKFSRQEIILRS